MGGIPDPLSAALSGRYAIQREIGAGGMATVYLAHDVRHDRPVALKVLKPELAAVVGAERFLAEIRTTANLQHPHILPLFDSGQAESFLFYVMPYVEGESLRERLDREHQLPVDEAVQIARDLAEALDYAHRKGVIHRDIKPANVLLVDGRPMLADFGIALAIGTAGGGRLTETGLSLGTPHYMSPEQATGQQHIGPASDIYALGCVLYEMLAGDPPFAGSTPQAVLGKILAGDFEAVTRHRRSVPDNIDAAIRRAVERLPADRFAHAAELARALADPLFGHRAPHPVGTSVGSSARQRATVATLASVAVLASGLAGWAVLRASPPLPSQRLAIVLPADRPMEFGWTPGHSLAISPDGMLVVYASNPDPTRFSARTRRLVVRTLDSRSVRDLPGTEAASQPFFSPDGQWIGFFTPTELKKVPVTGGSAVTVAAGVNAGLWSFGVWTEDDEIIFGTTDGAGLHRVSAEGGAPETLASMEPGDGRHEHPEAVPGRRTILFTRRGQGVDDVRIEAVDRDTGRRTIVVPNAQHPKIFGRDHLLYERGGELLAVRFDADRLQTIGQARPVADRLRTDGSDPGRSGEVLQYAVSRVGTMVYAPVPEGAEGSIGIVRPDGRFEPIGPPLVNPSWALPRVSPDGRFVAFADGPVSGLQAYLVDLSRGTTERISQSGTTWGLAWHPNGASLALASRGPDGAGVFVRELAGAERLVVSEDMDFRRSPAWSPDGEMLAFTAQKGSQHDIWLVAPADPSSARPWLDSEANEYSPAFSPDGRWLAYVSNESGRNEVYARRHPEGERLRVSTDGGQGPVWSADGRELFFEGPYEGRQRLLATRVTTTGGSMTFGPPRPVLDMRADAPDGRTHVFTVSRNLGAAYDVLPNGDGFVMVRILEVPAREIVVVLNFAPEVAAAAN